MMSLSIRLALLSLVLLLFSGCASMGAYIQGATHMKEGDFAAAIPEFERSLAGLESMTGPGDPGAFEVRKNLAVCYLVTGQVDKAAPLIKVIDGNVAQYHGKGSSRDLDLQLLYSLYYFLLQDYSNAVEHAQRYKDLDDEYDSDDENDNAVDKIFALASIQTGDFNTAYDIAKTKLDRTLPIDQHIMWNEVMHSLFIAQDDFKSALPYAQEALDASVRQHGEGSGFNALHVMHLAYIYYRINNIEKALELFEEANDIYVKRFGVDNAMAQSVIFNIIACHKALHNWDKVEAMTAKGIRETAGKLQLAATHLDFLILSGNTLFDQFKYEESLEVFDKVLSQKEISAFHRFSALSSKAGSLIFLKRYDEAEEVYLAALSSSEEKGLQSRELLRYVYSGLSIGYAATGQNDKALASIAEYTDSLFSEMTDAMFLLSEEARISNMKAYLPDFRMSMNMLYGMEDNPAGRTMMLDIWLRKKGILLEGSRTLNNIIVSSDDRKVKELLQSLKEVREQITTQAYGVFTANEENRSVKLAALYERKQELESALSSEVQGATELIEFLGVDSKSVGAKLSPGSALVEVFTLDKMDFGDLKKGKTSHVVALVQSGGSPDDIKLVHLGEVKDIMAIAEAHKASVSEMDSMPSSALYEAAFKPIEDVLDGEKRIYLSVEGPLGQIPFETFVRSDGTFLIEEYIFNYLTSGRDLLGQPKKPNNGQMVILADPEFDAQPMVASHTRSAISLKTRGMSFTRLPETALEAERISSLFPAVETKVYLGSEASESAMASTRSPRFLHLATHGFFLEKKTVEDIYESVVADRTLLSAKTNLSGTSSMENPLLRSGLVLAGANVALQNPGMSEGIITAEKVAGYDLQGTEMVVLSACETGLGKQAYSEGTYGLQRAFIQAGARSLVMSMWQVPDLETRELMVSLYENITQGTSRCESLRQAMLHEMKVTRERHGKAYPFYWGSFVFVGEND